MIFYQKVIEMVAAVLAGVVDTNVVEDECKDDCSKEDSKDKIFEQEHFTRKQIGKK